MSAAWLLYGAYGYTGTLIAHRARARGHAPILAGRDPEKLAALGARLGLPTRTAALDDPQALAAALSGCAAVLHAAGPYSATARPMVEAALAARAHYLDVTGEIGVLESVLRDAARARTAGVALIPGVGFDVVPTDCLAADLALRLPAAVALELAIHAIGSPSRGTARTALEGLGHGGWARRDGQIVSVPLAWRTRRVPFADRERGAVTIPWGDVATAFHSTGIPNVAVYLAMPPSRIRALAILDRLRPVLRASAVQRLLRRRIDRTIAGPDAAARAAGRSEVWGEVVDATGRTVSGTLSAPEGYTFTADAAVRAVERVLAGVAPGAWTPSRAFGARFVLDCDGVVPGGSAFVG